MSKAAICKSTRDIFYRRQLPERVDPTSPKFNSLTLTTIPRFAPIVAHKGNGDKKFVAKLATAGDGDKGNVALIGEGDNFKSEGRPKSATATNESRPYRRG